MRKILLIMFLFTIMQNIALAEDYVFTPDDDLIFSVACTNGEELYSLFCGMNQSNNCSQEISIFNESNISFRIENAMYSKIEYYEVIGFSFPTNDGEYYSTVELKRYMPFGEKIENSDTYINTVNEYMQRFGSPQKTSIDERNKLMYKRESISWYVDEHNLTITLMYHDGDVSRSRFPELETYITEGDSRVK